MGLSSKGYKERSLSDYSPKFYMAVLEGTLLTNGDLKGSWRLRQGDTVKNEFCMVLMDRGVYDGGFNIGIPRRDPSKPSVQEIHDKWHSFEWCESTKGCSNIWGKGQNFQFGECYLVGVHDLRQRSVVLYKVGLAEMLRAKKFAGAAPAVALVPATRPTLSPAAPVAGTAVSAKPTTPKAATPKTITAKLATSKQTTPKQTTATIGQKRPRSEPGNKKAIKAATARVTAFLSKSNPNGGANGGYSNENVTSSAGGPRGECGDVRNRGGATRMKHILPGFVGVGAAGEIRSSTITTAGAAGAVVADTGVAVSTTGSAAPKKAYELTDFATLGACLKTEKLQITERAAAIRIALESKMTEHEINVIRGRVEEAKLVRALQKLRKKMMGDEQEVEMATAQLKRATADEHGALGVWNAKWASYVAPFIAGCEQDIKTKAQEIQRKTLEAETERLELEKALEQVHQLKKIGSFPPSDVPPIQ